MKIKDTHFVRELGQRYQPAGFGPLAKSWPPRRRYAGTYDEQWQRERQPKLPTDFCVDFYNCAHPDLVYDSHLDGAESVELTHLHPTIPKLAFQLPGYALLGAITDRAGFRYGHYFLLDTLEIDVAAMQVGLVWRLALPLYADGIALIETWLQESEILHWSGDGLPFNKSSVEIGVPMTLSSWSTDTGFIRSILPALYDLRSATENIRLRGRLAHGILSLLHTLGAQGKTWKDVGVAELSDLACTPGGRLSVGVIAALPEVVWRDLKGIDLIEKIGRGRIYYQPRHGETLKPLGSRLEFQLQLNNRKAGLLRILAKLCAEGYRPSDSALNVKPDAFAESRDKIAALLVRLAQGRLTDAEVSTLVTLLIELAPGEPELVDDTLAILEQEDIPDTIAAHMLPAFFTGLPDADWRIRRKVLGHMQERQRRRLSDLAGLI